MDDKLQEIRAILEDVLAIDASGLTQDSSFESLGLDSLDSIELIVEAEERFNVDLSDAPALLTVADLLDLLP
ncbi:MAG: hypothetical protein IJH83_04120 [Coriobacteriales bacterium]|nr:hypothetical protein [Coriobacteriales bacterium]